MDRKFLHAKGKGCSFRLIADCISEDVIATCTDQRVLGIKDLAVATSPSARRIDPCILFSSATDQGIAMELMEEQNTYTDIMKGNSSRSPSKWPSEVEKPFSETGTETELIWMHYRWNRYLSTRRSS
ncbi:hypothetical protein J6590_016190 [Homalodisca vitripennis]|nr:hypothetical protein J6590_016190 [Homalodisca vitripennis]